MSYRRFGIAFCARRMAASRSDREFDPESSGMCW